MNHLDLLLTLESDVSVPATAATLSGRSSLHYLPGASLRGAAAARLYGHNEDAAFDIFHTHQVQFGNAYPAWFDGKTYYACVPWPLSFKKPKGEAQGGPAYRNSATGPLPGQHGVVREPVWLLAGGATDLRTYGVRTSGGLRTTVAASGKASDGLLFQMDAITSGQQFVARVRVAEQGVLEKLRRELDGQTLNIGRSRNAEYGRVHCQVLAESLVKGAEDAAEPLAAVPSHLHVYLLSDVALVDELGSPVLVPTPEAFGLDPAEWSWDPVRSELDSRSYSPWVSAWRRPDMERYVIAAGSVVTFAALNQGSADLRKLNEQCTELHATGVGQYRYDGLGRVIVQPRWLQTPKIDDAKPCESEAVGAALPPPIVDAPFMQWVRREYDNAGELGGVLLAVNSFADEPVGKAIITGRMIPNSQWGQLQYAAQKALRGEPESLIPSFRRVADKGVSGLKWSQKVAGQPVVEHVTKLLEREKNAQRRCRLASELATEMRLRSEAQRHRQAGDEDRDLGGER